MAGLPDYLELLRLKLQCQKSMQGVWNRSSSIRSVACREKRTTYKRRTRGATRFFCVSRDFCVDRCGRMEVVRTRAARSDASRRVASAQNLLDQRFRSHM